MFTSEAGGPDSSAARAVMVDGMSKPWFKCSRSRMNRPGLQGSFISLEDCGISEPSRVSPKFREEEVHMLVSRSGKHASKRESI